MKDEITNILNEARQAPSVLNSQPWRFRVCGNTIEVYLDKQSGLGEVDPDDRLQIASCGTLIAHLADTIKKYGWNPKVNYFPRFEEENLLAYVELTRLSEKGKRTVKSGVLKQGRLKGATPAVLPDYSDKPEGDKIPEVGRAAETEDVAGAEKVSVEALQWELSSIATRKDTRLIIHEDSDDRKLYNHFKSKCGEMLDKEDIKKSLNMFLRTESADSATPFEDEALFSDRFFDIDEHSHPRKQNFHPSRQYMILMTSRDNRYSWTRSGEVLGDIMIHLRNKDMIGLMALPTICRDSCREWLRNELNIKEHPQFVLQMGHVQQKKHNRKRSLHELYKQGF